MKMSSNSDAVSEEVKGEVMPPKTSNEEDEEKGSSSPLPEREATEETTARSALAHKNPAQELLEVVGPAYAAPSCPAALFYLETLGIILLAAITALCSLAYNNIFSVVANKWMKDNVEQLTGFFGGEPWWVAIGAGSGIVVGVLKAYVFKFDTYSGFIEIVKELDVDLKESMSMAVVGLVSLWGGASVGPESGLAGVGGFLGKLSVKPMCALFRRVLGSDFSAEAEVRLRKLFILSAIVSAFATMLPTPACSVMFCVELMGAAAFVAHGFVYTGTIVQLGLAGSVSFLLYSSLEPFTYIKVAPEIPGYEYTTLPWKNVGLAILFGVCTPLALVFPFLFFAAIVKFLAVKLKTYLNSKFGNKARIVFMAFLGGLIFGVIGYILPLTPGDGNYQMDAVVQHGSQIASSVLIISAYGKMFTYWVSTEFGFVGGIFHPILTISVMFFRMAINETRIADILGTALSFVLLAAAFTPLPFSMFLMDLALFNLKASEQVSLFVAIVISHLMSAGVGFPQKFLSLGLKKVD